MTHSRLVIIGDGLVARQALSIAAFIAPAPEVRAEVLTPEQIWRTDLEFLNSDTPTCTEVFAAIGLEALNYARFDLWAKVRLAGFRCARLVHPAATIDPTAHVGGNCLVGAHVSIGPDVRLGEGCILNSGARIEAGTVIGSFCWIGANATLGGDTKVGAHTVFGAGVHIASGMTVGAHCEVTLPGSYDQPLAEGTFASRWFASPPRIYRG